MRGRPTRVALFAVSQPANSTINVLKTRFGDPWRTDDARDRLFLLA
jgi:hypothetical protein